MKKARCRRILHAHWVCHLLLSAGIALSLEVSEVLFHKKSEYQVRTQKQTRNSNEYYCTRLTPLPVDWVRTDEHEWLLTRVSEFNLRRTPTLLITPRSTER